MPKTFTDDVAAALPSALDGPFQVVDPGDVNSYFKIDPALSRIEAAGDARPLRRLTCPYYSNMGFASGSYLGTAIVAQTYIASGDAGFLTTPFFIPPDMDVAATSDVKAIVAPYADEATPAVIRFELISPP